MLETFVRTDRIVPVSAEADGSLALGLAVHLGPAVAFVLLVSATSFSLPWALAGFFALSLVNLQVVLRLERTAPSVDLPALTRSDWVDGLALVFAKGVGLGGAVVLAGWGLGTLISPASRGGWLLIGLAVLGTDLIYYWSHRALSHGRTRSGLHSFFRRKHAMHHGVEHLDFIRGNISSLVDTAVTGFQLPLAFLATLLGLDLTSTLVAYGLVLMLQATHHLNHTLHLGPLRYLFMDNHAHKLHHCPGGSLINHGALFSLWDLAFGTYFEDHALCANRVHQQREGLPLRRSPRVR